jgi:hypothetical protein
MRIPYRKPAIGLAALAAGLFFGALTATAEVRPACMESLGATARVSMAVIGTGSFRPSLAFAAPGGGSGPAGAALSGIIVPSSASPVIRTAVLAELSKAAGKDAEIYGNRRLDRHRRAHGEVMVHGAGWLQENLVRAGLALVDPGETSCGPALMRAEAEARAAKRGLWSDPTLILDIQSRKGLPLPDFLLLSGRVLTIGKAGSTTYLNFGGSYATDGTVVISRAVLADLTAAGHDPDELQGHSVRVRGYAVDHKGPEVRLRTPAALELMDNGAE